MSADPFAKHPRPWNVQESMVGRRYGSCSILDANGDPLLRMWEDTDGDLARAIVAAVNADTESKETR